MNNIEFKYKNLIATIVGVILLAGVLTVPLAFDHQSADARNVKVKSVKKTIKNKIQAITRAEQETRN